MKTTHLYISPRTDVFVLTGKERLMEDIPMAGSPSASNPSWSQVP